MSPCFPHKQTDREADIQKGRPEQADRQADYKSVESRSDTATAGQQDGEEAGQQEGVEAG